MLNYYFSVNYLKKYGFLTAFSASEIVIKVYIVKMVENIEILAHKIQDSLFLGDGTT